MSSKDLTFEDKVLLYLSRIEIAIGRVSSIGSTIERLYNDWKFPVGTMAEQMAPVWEKQEAKERAERQLDTIERQNKILTWTLVAALIGIFINAIVGIVAALIQGGIIRLK